ncbi:MAG: 23S rRNA (adenine(2503)-C(2))-methyltransferase RlmN [Planctomycetaceae bacterium]|nr:23S rRNA (adenine(2503)-C(2))-methyltransferase RlmN [Planctomycetaceae bacterium]
MLDLYRLSAAQLAAWLIEHGFAPVHAARLMRYLYRDGVADAAEMTDLPPRLRATIQRDTHLSPLKLMRQTVSADGLTRKFLLGLHDGETIETVLMRYEGRWTACLSSQAGCPLGCVFCATGQAGFRRNLTTGEIVAQAVFVNRTLSKQTRVDTRGQRRESLRNIVMMGMGEPLLNYDAVVAAMDVVCDRAGLAIGGKQITLSTVGVVPGIRRLADERQPCSLAVSLHAANQTDRARLVPAARIWPLDELLDACRYYTTQLGRRILFEWTLIAGQNDSVDHARELASLLQDIPAQVNVIPLNLTSGFDGEPGSHAAREQFSATLHEYGLPVSIRQRRGLDITAGCGQLANA